MTWLIKRFLIATPSILGVVTLSFFIIHLVPGDPVETMLGDSAAPVDVASFRHQLGLDLPLTTQFKNHWRSMIRGDLGESLTSQQPVLELIGNRLPATLELALATLLLSFGLGIPAGVVAALKENGWVDRTFLGIAMVGLSMPAFWLAPLLIWLFALELNWLPVSERGTFGHVILPAITLSSGILAIAIRMTRTSMLQVIKEDYIQVARAKGVSPLRLYFVHALKNALFPLLTVFGLITGSLLTGTVIVETIFDWPGLGSLVFEAIQQRDYPLVQGCVLVMALIYVAVNFCVDVLYQKLHPKVRL